MNNLYDRLPKYIQIKETIRNEIEKGTLQPGEQLPSESALIERFHASKMTVIRSLQELVQEGYLERVQGKGTYVTTPQISSPLIGVLIPGMVHGIFSIILRSIETHAHRLGYGIMLCSADEEEEKVLTFSKRLIEQNAAGIIAAPLERIADPARNAQWYNLFREAGIPVVLVDRTIPDVPDTVLVDTNNAEIMKELTREVIQRGHKRLALVVTEEIKSTTTDQRIEGFYKGAREASPAAEIAEILKFSEKDSFETTQQKFEQFLVDYEPTVVLTSHDLLAIHILSLLKNAPPEIGQHVSIVGFDDLPFAESLGLTTVRQPLEEEGRVAVDLLHQAIQGHEISSVQLPSQIIFRSSLTELETA